MTELSGQGGEYRHLRELSDPEFMTRWAMLRQSLFYIPREEPNYPELKRQYDAVAVEYRRRMGGGLAANREQH